jgi:hypothetical protein
MKLHLFEVNKSSPPWDPEDAKVDMLLFGKLLEKAGFTPYPQISGHQTVERGYKSPEFYWNGFKLGDPDEDESDHISVIVQLEAYNGHSSPGRSTGLTYDVRCGFGNGFDSVVDVNKFWDSKFPTKRGFTDPNKVVAFINKIINNYNTLIKAKLRSVK